MDNFRCAQCGQLFATPDERRRHAYAAHMSDAKCVPISKEHVEAARKRHRDTLSDCLAEAETTNTIVAAATVDFSYFDSGSSSSCDTSSSSSDSGSCDSGSSF